MATVTLDVVERPMGPRRSRNPPVDADARLVAVVGRPRREDVDPLDVFDANCLWDQNDILRARLHDAVAEGHDIYVDLNLNVDSDPS